MYTRPYQNTKPLLPDKPFRTPRRTRRNYRLRDRANDLALLINVLVSLAPLGQWMAQTAAHTLRGHL